MASRSDDSKADSGAASGGGGSKSGSSRRRPSADAVERALAEVSQTLERLKQVRAERAEAEARFKVEIKARDDQLAALQARVSELEAGDDEALESAQSVAQELEAERDDLLARVTALDEKLGAAEAAIETEREARSAAEARIEAAQQVAEGELERLNKEMAEAKAAFEARAAEREASLAEVQERLDTQNAEHARATAELQEQLQTQAAERERAQAEAERLAAQVSEQDAAHQKALAEASASAGSLQEEHQEAARRAEELAERLKVLEQDNALQRETIEQFESKLAEAEGLRERVTLLAEELETAHQRAGELEASGAAALADAEKQAEDLLAQVLETERIADERKEALEKLRAEVEAGTADADSRVGELEQKASELEFRAVAAEESLAQASQEAAENARVLESTISQQKEELDRISRETQELREANEAISREKNELAERAAQGDAGADERVQTLESERQELLAALDTEREQVREMSEKLDLAADRLAELQQALEEREAEVEAARAEGGAPAVDTEALERLQAEAGELREQLAAVQEERDTLRADAAERMTTARESHPDSARIALRQERLRRARRLLREHAAKADQADELLAQRMTQCEDVLSRRRELVQAREVIERAHKRVLSAKGRSGAAATIFFGLGAVAVLAALSWAVVTRSIPAKYAASGVLAAEFTEAPATSKDLEAWQEFHEKLLFDPQLMSQASERLAQRGFVELSQPAALKLALEQDMSWEVPEPGKIAFELRGYGREATSRMLESYLTSLVAQSSALRQRRSEASTTVIAEPVRAGVEPIEDPRLAYVGIGVGGGSLVCLVLWFGIWRRMVKAKSAFENSTAVDHLLEDARWVDPIQKIIESGDGMKDKAA